MVLFIMIIHVFICLCVSHLYSLMYFADDVSISGFKDVISEQSTAESAIEAATGQEHEGGESPDSASAASQSIDEPTKDTVRNSGFGMNNKKPACAAYSIFKYVFLTSRCQCWCWRCSRCVWAWRPWARAQPWLWRWAGSHPASWEMSASDSTWATAAWVRNASRLRACFKVLSENEHETNSFSCEL